MITNVWWKKKWKQLDEKKTFSKKNFRWQKISKKKIPRPKKMKTWKKKLKSTLFAVVDYQSLFARKNLSKNRGTRKLLDQFRSSFL